MTRSECKNLASMKQYVAGDGKTYSVSENVRKEINFFVKGTASAYTGFHGSQITCTGGVLKVDGSDIYNMVMYVTEEILYRTEKIISRDDEDGSYRPLRQRPTYMSYRGLSLRWRGCHLCLASPFNWPLSPLPYTKFQGATY